MNIKIQNLVTNPNFLFWIIVISTIIVILWASAVFKNRHTTSKDELKRDTHTILMLTITTLFITGFHYWSMGQQGLQTIFVNPYTAVKAANLAPSVTQITSAETLNNLSDKQKKNPLLLFLNSDAQTANGYGFMLKNTQNFFHQKMFYGYQVKIQIKENQI